MSKLPRKFSGIARPGEMSRITIFEMQGKALKRLLITGASGGLGRVASARLGHLAEEIRLSDVAPLPFALPSRAEFVQCDLADADAVMKLVNGCDGILHLGGISTERKFSEILDANILGMRNLYEAARAHGMPRIFFGSSNHVTGYYEQGEHVDLNSPYRPDGLYAVSKCFGEALARFYFDRFGQETAIVRIGSCFDEPTDYRMLATWLSYDDFVALVERVFDVPRLGCPVIWGVSDNSRAWWTNETTTYIGWRPRDSADGWETTLKAQGKWPDPEHPLAKWQGGNNTQDPIVKED